MVVKYVKIIVATLTLVVVGLVTSINIHGVVKNGIDYRILGTGSLVEINGNDLYQITIDENSSGNTMSELFTYMQVNNLKKINITAPDVSTIYFYDGSNPSGWFSPTSDVFKLELTYQVNGYFGIKLVGLDETMKREVVFVGDTSNVTWYYPSTTKIYTDLNIQSGLSDGYDDGYDAGISTVHENGFAGIYNPFTSQFYNNEDSFSYLHGYYVGYDVGYDEAEDGFDYESYYSLGIKMAYTNGFGGYINPLTNEYYDITNSFSYIKGFNNALGDDFTFTGLLFQVFAGIGSVLTIELLPNVTLGAIVAVPIVFGIIYFILGKRKGD